MSRKEISALVITPDGEATSVGIDPSDAQAFHNIVGGYFEAFSGPGWVGFCNEDGKARNLQTNWIATSLAIRLGWHRYPGDVLVGTVIFTGPADKNSDATSFPFEKIIGAGLTVQPEG